MESSAYAFSKYLDKKVQITKPYNNKYSTFNVGEVILVKNYELLGENRDVGVYITSDGRTILEHDISNVSAIFNPYNPTVPIYHGGKIEVDNKIADPYNTQKQPIKFDDDTPITNTPIPPQPNTANQKVQQNVVETIPTNKTARSTIFDSFQTEENNFTLKMKLKLPKTSLLKSMYQSSADKDSFITDLAYYISNQITEEDIQNTLKGILEKKK